MNGIFSFPIRFHIFSLNNFSYMHFKQILSVGTLAIFLKFVVICSLQILGALQHNANNMHFYCYWGEKIVCNDFESPDDCICQVLGQVFDDLSKAIVPRKIA